MKNYLTHQVAIIGAGPYGLAAAAHLRAVGVETCIFGKVMEFWENQMPAGMFLRSSWEASSHFALDWSIAVELAQDGHGPAVMSRKMLTSFREVGFLSGQGLVNAPAT
jgi:cation diffusion facilitator CzcD-associated flavoprotein CzcO